MSLAHAMLASVAAGSRHCRSPGRRGLSPGQVVTRFARAAPRAVHGRRHASRLLGRMTIPIPQRAGDAEEKWAVGYNTDVILTRDTWMHRIDIARATGAPLRLSAGHDGVIVADVVGEWAGRHGQPCTLTLTGPADGT